MEGECKRKGARARERERARGNEKRVEAGQCGFGGRGCRAGERDIKEVLDEARVALASQG